MINFLKLLASRERGEDQHNTSVKAIRLALIEGEKSGISDRTPEDIRRDVQERLREDGELLHQVQDQS